MLKEPANLHDTRKDSQHDDSLFYYIGYQKFDLIFQNRGLSQRGSRVKPGSVWTTENKRILGDGQRMTLHWFRGNYEHCLLLLPASQSPKVLTKPGSEDCLNSLFQLPSRFWSNKQPDNGGGDEKWGEEHCVHIEMDTKKWNDRRCNNSMNFICEKNT